MSTNVMLVGREIVSKLLQVKAEEEMLTTEVDRRTWRTEDWSEVIFITK